MRILKRRVQELFTHRKDISTSRAHHEGRQPFIECAKHDFKIIYFPFFIIINFFELTRVLPLLLRSFLSKNVHVFFKRFILIANKESLGRWTLKQCFNF